MNAGQVKLPPVPDKNEVEVDFHLMIIIPMLLMILHQEAKKKQINLIEAFWIDTYEAKN